MVSRVNLDLDPQFRNNIEVGVIISFNNEYDEENWQRFLDSLRRYTSIIKPIFNIRKK